MSCGLRVSLINLVSVLTACATLSACSKSSAPGGSSAGSPATVTAPTAELTVSAQLKQQGCPTLDGIYEGFGSSSQKTFALQTINNGVAEYAIKGQIIRADGKPHLIDSESYVATCSEGTLKVVVSRVGEQADKAKEFSFANYSSEGDMMLLEDGEKRILRLIAKNPVLPAHVASECPAVDGAFKEENADQHSHFTITRNEEGAVFTIDGNNSMITDNKLHENSDQPPYVGVCSKQSLAVISERGMMTLSKDGNALIGTMTEPGKASTTKRLVPVEKKQGSTRTSSPESMTSTDEAKSPSAPEVPAAPVTPVLEDNRMPAPSPRFPVDETDKY